MDILSIGVKLLEKRKKGKHIYNYTNIYADRKTEKQGKESKITHKNKILLNYRPT